ncbi:hypothetical protein [Cellulomonas endophytica]|uniref:hypothetical protein n=1 Tax=Cellulomonas endophytica TaxID=2494735 RepID=UPI0010102161|nr:hypothetical protein [Cellulomonas endophytica]
MGVLESVLLAVAANLAGDALTGAAKAGWRRLRSTLVNRSTNARASEVWLDRFEAEPTEEVARGVARRFHELGLDEDPEVLRCAGQILSQVAIGTGATNASISINHGSVGGVHYHGGIASALQLTASGLRSFLLTNASETPLTITSINTVRGVMRLDVREVMPRCLTRGEAVSLIVEGGPGQGVPTVIVHYELGSARHNQTFSL